MYYIVFKNYLPPKEIEISKDNEIEFQFIGGFGARDNIVHVLNILIYKFKLINLSSDQIEEMIEKSDELFKDTTPVTLVKVNKKYDPEFAYELMLTLSFFQGYPATPFFLSYFEGGKSHSKFLTGRKYEYSYNTLFPYGTKLYLDPYIKNVSRYKYVLELLFEANKEERNGLKVAKYFTILEALSHRLEGNKPHQRIEKLFDKYKFTQPYIPNKYKIDFKNYHNKLSWHYLNKSDFSYMEVMTAYRNFVVHYGDITPSIIFEQFDSRNEMMDLLEFGVYLIIKQIILDNEPI